MDHKTTQFRPLALLVCAVGLLGTPIAAHATIYHVGLPTDTLNTQAVFPYSLDFLFTDGSGTGDGNNTVSLTNFAFDPGGAPLGSPVLTGGASGSLGTGLTLTDNSFVNEAIQGFTPGSSPGSSLSFDLSTTTNFDGVTPDLLSAYLVDGNNNTVPTTDSAAQSLFTIELDSGGPSVTPYAGVAPYMGLTPTITPAGPSPVPELSSFFSLGALLAGGTLTRLRLSRFRWRAGS